jgi:hypothetical protein
LATAERETTEFARFVVVAVALCNLDRKAESDAALVTLIKDDADVGAFQSPNDPLLEPLGSDPRWVTFQRSMGLTEDQLK